MNKKYILTGETNVFGGKTLHRIQAIKDFGDVHAGDLGGWIEGEWNLDHDKTCWIYDDAIVKDDAFVLWNAIVKDCAIIRDYARIGGDAVISEHAVVSDMAVIRDNAQVGGHSLIGGNTKIFNNAIVREYTSIDGCTIIGKNAYITSKNDYLCIDSIYPRNYTLTFYVDKDRNICAATGCFNDTLEALEQAVAETYGNNKYAQQYYHAIQLAKARLR